MRLHSKFLRGWLNYTAHRLAKTMLTPGRRNNTNTYKHRPDILTPRPQPQLATTLHRTVPAGGLPDAELTQS